MGGQVSSRLESISIGLYLNRICFAVDGNRYLWPAWVSTSSTQIAGVWRSPTARRKFLVRYEFPMFTDGVICHLPPLLAQLNIFHAFPFTYLDAFCLRILASELLEFFSLFQSLIWFVRSLFFFSVVVDPTSTLLVCLSGKRCNWDFEIFSLVLSADNRQSVGNSSPDEPPYP